MIALPIERIAENLKKHEGFRSYCYRCPSLAWSIGYGRNIDKDRGGLGITEQEADYLLRNDIDRCIVELRSHFKWFDESPVHIQGSLIELCFWLGLTRLRKFKRMLSALAKQNYEQASDELVDSLLFRQIPGRTQIIADRISG